MTRANRRVFLGFALGSAAASALAAPAQGAAAVGLATPAEIFRAYRKMRFAFHERPLFWWMKATKYGLVDDELTPLYGMEIASIFQAIARPGGLFAARSLEVVYSTDVASGELLTEWRNPYTNAVVPVNNVPVGPNTVEYDLAGPKLPTELPGAKLEGEHSFGEAWVHSGGVWIRDDTSAVVTQLDGKGKPFRVYDWPTYHAALDDVLDPDVDSAPTTVSFQAVSTWQRWMGMQEKPGNLMTRGSGKKVADYDELPQSFRSLFEANHPELAEDPAAALDRDAYRFER